jgi:hypothetical protein
MEHSNMTKLSKWLGGTAVAAFMGLTLFAVAGVFTASDAAAESPPAPPAAFAGKVTVDGQPAAPGTVIQARIGAASCGVATVYSNAGEARYNLEVPALEPNSTPNCGVEGAAVTFWVGDRQAQESGSWLNYQLNLVDLTVVTATATPSASPSASATPKPPVTGTGMGDTGSDLSAVWLFTVLGLGAAAFGAAGVAASRRSH